MQIRVLLIDHSKPTEKPLAAQVLLDDSVPEEILSETVTISCGDGAAQGAVTIPVHFLTLLMGKVMGAQEQRRSGIVMPTPPKIILPN